MYKARLLISATLLLMLGASAVSYSQTGCAGSGNLDNNFVAMKQLSPGIGWVQSRCRLYWTSDNGRQWNNITPPMSSSQTLESTAFADKSHGWETLWDSSPASKFSFLLAITENAGATWKIQGLDASFSPAITASHGDAVGLSLQFLDQTHGWVFFGTGSQLSSSGFLMATTDGGQHWNILPAVPSAGALVFSSISSATLVGNRGDQMWATLDGGRSWATISLPEPANCKNCRVVNISKVQFPTATAGFVTVVFLNPKTESYSATSFTSADQGQTWTEDTQDTALIASVGVQFNTAVDSHQLHMSTLPRRREMRIYSQSGMQTLTIPEVIRALGQITDASFATESAGWILFAGGGCALGHPAPCPNNANTNVDVLSAASGVLTVITPHGSAKQPT